MSESRAHIRRKEASRRPEKKSSWRTLFNMARLLAVIYLAICLLMMFLENTLVFPKPRFSSGDWNPTWIEYDNVTFFSADGTKLHGWYVKHPQPKAIVLFCHGNFEHVANTAHDLQRLRDEMQVSVFAFDYRGYGRSEGKAEEHGVIADGHAAMEWLIEREKVKPTDIVIIGRSLGGAIAVDVAAAKGARGLVLQSTFASAPDVAASAYPWIPVRLLMHTKLDSLSKIRNYDGPLLQTHGSADGIVPIKSGRRLFNAAASDTKKFVEVKGGGHNDAQYHPRYWKALRDFLWGLPQSTH